APLDEPAASDLSLTRSVPLEDALAAELVLEDHARQLEVAVERGCGGVRVVRRARVEEPLVGLPGSVLRLARRGEPRRPVALGPPPRAGGWGRRATATATPRTARSGSPNGREASAARRRSRGSRRTGRGGRARSWRPAR